VKAPTAEQPSTYSFGPFFLHVPERKLEREGRPVSLTGFEFDLLCELVVEAWERPGKKLTSEELLKRLWPDVSGSTEKLRTHASNLREKLGQRSDGSPYIARGSYVLAVSVAVAHPAAAEPPNVSAPLVSMGQGADPGRPPYVGPQPFPPDRAHQFFGRASECARLIERVTDPSRRVTLLYSPSGAGKTSLINTALRIGLAGRGLHVLPVARVGVLPGRPAEAQNLYTFAALTSIGSDPVQERAGFSTWSTWLEPRMPPGTNGTVLIIDQLEEIVTTPLGPPHQKRDFFLQLRDAVDSYSDLRVVLAFREDYLPELQRLGTDLSAYWATFPLERLGRDGAAQAITGPAATEGLAFDPQVVNALVDELARVRYVDALGQSYDEPGEFVEPLQLRLSATLSGRACRSG
jgi:hypothetical protein